MKGQALVSAVALAVAWTVTANASPMAHGKASQSEPRYLQVAGIFGESEEEKAIRLAAEKRENDQDAALQDLKGRVQDLERALQQSNSQSEMLQHRVQEMKATVDKLQKDFDYRLCSVTAQLMGVSTSVETGGISCDGRGTGAMVGVGGTLGGGAVAIPSARKTYDDGMKQLARAQYDEAQASFHSFLDANPKDELAPKALYWIGSISFLKRDFAGAAASFAEGVKLYSKSGSAPEFMLKLGQSLIAMGQQREGCSTLAVIKSKYPKSPADILGQAAKLHSESCK